LKKQSKADVAYTTQVDLNLDLGNSFRFKGQGADVYMAGNLRLHSEADDPEIHANGTVKITRGTYVFYGQTLTVQRGLVTFAGPIDDPSINILATRSIGTTEVGVEVSGTLADTRARLSSNPDMPDEEKLAWMLFGRSTSDLSGNDISAIAGAASLLLGSDQGRKFTERFGIDSINVGAVGTNVKGNSGTYVGVGKQFTDRFGVAYEQGIDTVSSVLKITWSLSRSWQVVLRGGTVNGVDLQYRRRFDRISFTDKQDEKN
jgi:translocation and assembly module TamB